ncbi:MAG: hypothetical protein A2Y62_08915 [Candidatus Fischerbacteria bacterium RBG_13_37_8]|uniref:Lipoprotein n=1 Tax=Candidatus Fischerbacteria bacterium RBG_13_37_8 TaxID=1817863 RepID=A0A1F5VUY9_9BACT|nr:MAG: hypothetical protein A2Y62_08915 [Candidatus Fischerbacteria bacterium RBG_13_37_8]
MKSYLTILSFILCFTLQTACLLTEPENIKNNENSPPIPVLPDKQFILKINQTALLKSENIQIEFLRVTADSRCPSDVTCIWAGEVTIELAISKDDVDKGKITLINGASEKLKSFYNIDGYCIDLLKVEPYPSTLQKINPADYSITLIIKSATCQE